MNFSQFSSSRSFIFIVLIGSGLVLCMIPGSFRCKKPSYISQTSTFKKGGSFQSENSDGADSPTNLNHLAFGLLSSQATWRHRKSYVESWWRPNATCGFLLLDTAPNMDLLPWSPNSPPYKVSDVLTDFFNKVKPASPIAIRLVRGIMEVFREVDKPNLRWLVIGDDDSIFFIDNLVDVLRQYDHSKYYYIGGQSEFSWSNYLLSFNQGFRGAGIILSYPTAKALAADMENCLKRYAHLNYSDVIVMSCVADIGVNLSPHKGINQIDLSGDASGFLSSHPKFPLLSLHHLDNVEPLFPGKDRKQSMSHLMAAATIDQTRMLQTNICYDRKKNWAFSISWGYSAYIYERIMARSYLTKPIETFKPRFPGSGPLYIFDTRRLSTDSCEAPHLFFLEKVERGENQTLTTYRRSKPRGLKPCDGSGNKTAEAISEIHVFSPSTKRKEMERSECCDVVRIEGSKAEIKYRECEFGELIN